MCAVDRGRYTCLVGEQARTVTAMRARELGRKSVVVGDRVGLVGDSSGSTGTLARIVRINDRRSVLRRSADDTDTVERIIVANASHLVIVCASANPQPRTGFVDRALVAAYAGNLEPVLCMTKVDLRDPADFVRPYAEAGITILTWRRDEPATAIEEFLGAKDSVLFGHSGVGKSTLVNALVPAAHRATADVAEGTGKGRHTSSSAVALTLPRGGIVIDTPGVRSLGLGHVKPEMVLNAFPDLAAGSEECPNGCEHLSADGGCNLDLWVAEGNSTVPRLESVRRLLRSQRSLADDS